MKTADILAISLGITLSLLLAAILYSAYVYNGMWAQHEARLRAEEERDAAEGLVQHLQGQVQDLAAQNHKLRADLAESTTVADPDRAIGRAVSLMSAHPAVRRFTADDCKQYTLRLQLRPEHCLPDSYLVPPEILRAALYCIMPELGLLGLERPTLQAASGVGLPVC